MPNNHNRRVTKRAKINAARREKQASIDAARMEKQKIIDAADEKLKVDLRDENTDLRGDLIELVRALVYYKGRPPKNLPDQIRQYEVFLEKSEIPYCSVVATEDKLVLNDLVTGAQSIAELENENAYFTKHRHELLYGCGLSADTILYAPGHC